jgi:hypothetical protein
MENFIVSITAKVGHEDSVAEFYRDIESLLKTAKGYRGRKIYQAKQGAHVDAVRKSYTEEELKAHAEPPHGPQGVDFIIIEMWDNIDDRMDFSKNILGSRTRELFPHLEPAHSHEFFKDISVE